MNILFIICGYVASGMFSILFIPQLLKIIHTKQVNNISFSFIMINIMANACNIIFGTGLYINNLKQASLPILSGCSIAFIWSILLLYLKCYYNRPNT